MSMRLAPSLLLVSAIWTWIHRLVGPGLILLGIIDNSAIPIPGGMDIFVILLAAHRREWWLYYAFMAVVGAVLGGYLTYRLAEKGGEETLEKKIGKSRAQKVYDKFKKRGFATIAISAVLPPPFPMVPVLMAAGVLQYPRKKFLSALASGRAVRFLALAILGRFYGTAILASLRPYYEPLLYTLIALGGLAALAALLYFKWYRPNKQRQERSQGQQVESFPIPFHRRRKSGNEDRRQT
jgi:membrane protein YqaA with SNARE-associated domain